MHQMQEVRFVDPLQLKRLNTLCGWAIFVIASFVYISTIESTASFWDCGEYIACSYKLEVGHPPGAPLFLIIARFFSLFAAGDCSKAAVWVNVMSALCSAFTILFLYWTITRLALKIVLRKGEQCTRSQVIAIIGTGAIGALAYTFSDSFWFSAVEGEVYAMSSFFTALVFWAILKWEEEADSGSAMRWLVLIAYLTGLSIGVHLLNLLVIPAICFVYYYKKFPFSKKGWFITGIVSLLLLGAVQSGIIPGIVKLAADYEVFFVNKAGLGFNSGTLIYFVLLAGSLVAGIAYSLNKKPACYKATIAFASLLGFFGVISGNGVGAVFLRLLVTVAVVYGIVRFKHNYAALNVLFMSFTVLLIGYSSFILIVIRSQANTPMDENNPENAVNLLSYLNREQYGDWPIGYGNYFNSPLDREKPYKDGNPIYARDNTTGKYAVIDDQKEEIPNYDPEFSTVFPRMWNTESMREPGYKYWGEIRGKPKQVMGRNGQPETVYVPTFAENLTYFKNYQVGYMYLRYFAWNFIGRQNDLQGLNDNPTEGNWISGFRNFDESRLGTKLKSLPAGAANNKAENTFYGLPFILGMIGMVFHFRKQTKDAFVIFCLFICTGFAIVIYLNQFPYQARERDYAYAASFYAFAIWIGFGAFAIYDFVAQKISSRTAVLAAMAVSITVPSLMAAQGWDDHNRSKRTMARDFAINYLQSCAPNAILFTNGDNDTFPLWYAQEVEGVRTDVRVCNLSLLQSDWYINQMRRAAYESAPVPFTLAADKYAGGKRKFVLFSDRNIGFTNVKELMNFVGNDDPQNKLNIGRDKPVDYFPSSKISIPVDSMKVLNNGTVEKELAGRIVKSIDWEIKRQVIYRNDLMLLDLLAGFNWDRPLYFSVTAGSEALLGLEDYMQLEGLAYRLVPVKVNQKEAARGGRVNTTAMYDNIMHKFKNGGAATEGVYLDENCMRMLDNLRMQMGTLASALIEEGKKDKAMKVLNKAMKEIPETAVPYGAPMYSICLAYYELGKTEQANLVSEKLFGVLEKDLLFYNQLRANQKPAYGREIRQAKEILMRLTSVAGMYKQKTLYADFEKRLRLLIPQEELYQQ